MLWTKKWDLFLFDLDGLLVETEKLHYQAYVLVCAKRGYTLDWSFLDFCEVAHRRAEGLKEAIYAKFPSLQEEEPNWKVLYEEKKRTYLELVATTKIALMPGAFALLQTLEKQGKKRCVVTNSCKEQTDLIASKIPILQSIPHWITRELYQEAKPSPECYLYAIQKYAEPGDKIIGFEDSSRGIQALLKTPAVAVLVCPKDYALLTQPLSPKLFHFEGLDEIPDRMEFG